ncbi:MAG: hypothetical protein SNJ50_16980, partial [Cyanobacteriota bacterium]
VVPQFFENGDPAHKQEAINARQHTNMNPAPIPAQRHLFQHAQHMAGELLRVVCSIRRLPMQRILFIFYPEISLNDDRKENLQPLSHPV